MPCRGDFVIRGATILSVDAAIGNFPHGDVHVRDGAIVAVAKQIAAPGATVIDAGGMICMPGFIETHWHLWTTLLQPMMRIDDPKRGYFPVSNSLGRHFTAQDSYRSMRLGLAEALSTGATTVHNWAHNIATPDPEATWRELQHVTGGRVTASGERRRDPVGRIAENRCKGQHVDRSHGNFHR